VECVSNADYYEIYASDNHNTPISLWSPEIDHVDYLTMQAGTVDFDTLPNNGFRLFADDAMVTPFSDKTQVTFVVRAVNSWVRRLLICSHSWR